MASNLLKEVGNLYKNLSKLTIGQAILEDVDYDESTEEQLIYIVITPNDGLYKDARMKFLFRVGSSYPETVPEVTCLNRIYHPNIDLPDEDFDKGGSVCVNTLDSDWEPNVGLEGCIISLLFLFYNPNIDDPLSPVFGGGLSEEELAENVYNSVRGMEVEGYQFDDIFVGENVITNSTKPDDGVQNTDQPSPTNESIDEEEVKEVEEETELTLEINSDDITKELVMLTAGTSEVQDNVNHNFYNSANDVAQPDIEVMQTDYPQLHGTDIILDVNNLGGPYSISKDDTKMDTRNDETNSSTSLEDTPENILSYRILNSQQCSHVNGEGDNIEESSDDRLLTPKGLNNSNKSTYKVLKYFKKIFTWITDRVRYHR